MKWKADLQNDLQQVQARLQTYHYLVARSDWPLAKRIARYWQRRDELTEQELEDLKTLQQLSDALKVIDTIADTRASLVNHEWEF